MKKALAILLIAASLLAVCSCFGKNKAERDAMAQREVCRVGGVWERTNTDYDVSRYWVLEDYELNSSDITITDSEFKEYAESRLDSIIQESVGSIRGTYQDYNFLIVRRDRYDEWARINLEGSIDYIDGYGVLSYNVQYEMSAFRNVRTDLYKDPSDKYIIFTNCGDYKVITEFFE